jgi:CRISPR-associated protein Cmr4
MEAADLPVQKDTFGYPVLWSNSVKGAFRSTFRRKNGNGITTVEKVIFGSEIGIAEDYASAMTILDARLFAIPTRSLTGVYAYITTPHLLKRAKTLFEYLEALGIPGNSLKRQRLDSMLKKEEKMPVASSNKLFVAFGTFVLAEETIKDVKLDEELASDVENLLQGVNLPIDVKDISERFVLVDDEHGRQLIRKSLLLLTRTALDYKTKTVKPGALWTEEYVPEMSLFYTTIMMGAPKLNKGQESTYSSNALMEKLLETLGSDAQGNFYLVLGGHETIGKGIVKFCAW